MTPILIILGLVALGVVIVFWATRKPGAPPAGPQDGDTAWNDPVAPGEPARPDAFADTPSTRDPRP